VYDQLIRTADTARSPDIGMFFELPDSNLYPLRNFESGPRIFFRDVVLNALQRLGGRLGPTDAHD